MTGRAPNARLPVSRKGSDDGTQTDALTEREAGGERRRCWDAITAEGLRFHEAQPPLGPAPAEGQAKRRGRKPRRTGHNLLRRLQARKEDALRFLADPAVPFTNNQAEQDVRMMKVKQKISGGFRSKQGANDFATVRGFISTAKKQGWNIIQALMENPQSLIARLQAA